MARGFDENEKEAIRNALIEKGKDLFLKYGLKKTGIGELTKAVGIAQGSFYLFYNSKEELYFDIMEKEEMRFQSHSAELLGEGGLNETSFRKLLVNVFAYMENNPIINMFLASEDYEKLVRKISKEKLEKHSQEDNANLLPVIKRLQQEGKIGSTKPEAIAGLFRAFFTLPLHKKEIGENVYDDVVELVIDMTVEKLFNTHE